MGRKCKCRVEVGDDVAMLDENGPRPVGREGRFPQQHVSLHLSLGSQDGLANEHYVPPAATSEGLRALDGLSFSLVFKSILTPSIMFSSPVDWATGAMLLDRLQGDCSREWTI